MMKHKYELDEYEQEIEDSFEKQEGIATQDELDKLKMIARKHLKSKRSITIRVAEQDIEAIKLKASRLGLAYQTYINMLIHKEATKI